MEMAHGLTITERADGWQASNRNSNRHKSRNFHLGSEWFNRTQRPPGSGQLNRKPPCVCCSSPHHGVWAFTAFLQKGYQDRWQLAKDKRFCFRCLAGDHQGKTCMKSQTCQIDGCRGNHHRLLHQSLPVIDQPAESVQPVVESNSYHSLHGRGVAHFAASSEGEDSPISRAITTHNPRRFNEAYLLRTIPVWVKVEGRKVKVNAILNDASNESFLNEEVAGALGLKESHQTVKVHVLNNSVETFQIMPLKIEIESVNDQFTKEIEVKTCPRSVTGNYQVKNWRTGAETSGLTLPSVILHHQRRMAWWTC